MWKFLNESVEGTSHRATGVECQDSSFVTPFRLDTDSGLILACSDGAGSAKESKIGSKMACEAAVQHAMHFLEGGHTVAEATVDVLRGWVTEVHAMLRAEAGRRELVPRDLACTLLVALVGEAGSAFLQIGDGGIVVLEEEEYRPVFWPQAGQYHNTTFFVTDDTYDQNIQAEVRPTAPSELCVFSDGLQMLALNYAKRAAHQPFFTPIFRMLRATEDHQELIIPMRQWMDSPAINQRTDDDKTLVLATRVQANGQTAV